MEFPTAETVTKNDIFLCQKKLLETARVIVDIFEQHNIEYIIFFGSLLGAVRHKGFIPWDDDFDIVVFDKDYSRAIECLERELPSKYLLHNRKTDPFYFHSWTRVKNLSVEVAFENHYHPHNLLVDFSHLGVDIHCFKKLKMKEVDDYLQFEQKQFFLRKFEMGIINQSEFDEGIKAAENRIHISPTLVQHNGDEVVYANVVGLNAPIKSQDIFPIIELDFADQIFRGPSNYSDILKSVYGEYNILPRYSDRRPSLKSIKILK